MALPRSLNRIDLPVHTVGDAVERDSLLALSQRKLNAIGLPLAYVDCDRHYRFVNKAFLEWTGKAFVDVIGQEIQEVDGRDAFQLYEAYVDAAVNLIENRGARFAASFAVSCRPSSDASSTSSGR